jgi:hypothetical protein
LNPELRQTLGVMTRPELRALQDVITELLNEPRIRRYPVATPAKARMAPIEFDVEFVPGYPDR